MFKTKSGWNLLPIFAILAVVMFIAAFLPTVVLGVISVFAIGFYVFIGSKKEGFGSIVQFALLLIVLTGLWLPWVIKTLFLG